MYHQSAAFLGVSLEPNLHLGLGVNNGHELSELTAKVSSNPSTCILELIPTRPFNEISPLINTSILDLINLSLLTGYVPQTFKVAVITPLLKKKPSLDPGVLANY